MCPQFLSPKIAAYYRVWRERIPRILPSSFFFFLKKFSGGARTFFFQFNPGPRRPRIHPVPPSHLAAAPRSCSLKRRTLRLASGKNLAQVHVASPRPSFSFRLDWLQGRPGMPRGAMIPALCGIPAAVLLLPPQLRPARWLTIRTLSFLPPASRHAQMTAPRIPDNPRVAVGMA